MISEAVRSTPFLLGQILDRPAQAYPERNALEWEGGQLATRRLGRRFSLWSSNCFMWEQPRASTGGCC